MGVPIQDFLANRRNRALGSILGNAEREFFDRLTPEQRDRFRMVVRDAVNSYHDSVLDLVKAEDGVMRNEEVLGLLERLERKLTTGQRAPIPASITSR